MFFSFSLFLWYEVRSTNKKKFSSATRAINVNESIIHGMVSRNARKIDIVSVSHPSSIKSENIYMFNPDGVIDSIFHRMKSIPHFKFEKHFVHTCHKQKMPISINRNFTFSYFSCTNENNTVIQCSSCIIINHHHHNSYISRWIGRITKCFTFSRRSCTPYHRRRIPTVLSGTNTKNSTLKDKLNKKSIQETRKTRLHILYYETFAHIFPT